MNYEGNYYVYPDGTIYSAEDTTLDSLLLQGWSDDCYYGPLPHDDEGVPYVPEEG